ncbi:MAG: hypothetical protein Q7U92_17775 [Bradyrhizobium sp.]|uniref:hypothetical protein n=1 Tax=Bradyrhizobium sp. TaxID=376 RepID=UPI00271B8878|nr:hypothetical protein [Bradyrhizobium sp.]MDO9060851.1 hypothetical protein [Bradyrhizobium sp.]MDO9562732.1 hypothetical protein [Bradyrhizobium sp.]MDP3694163.1 hypothetical protein [Bradyrhizobium sp.]
MKKLAISLIVGAAALFATAASAAPLSKGIAVLPDSNIEQVRMVCDARGRCWQQRSNRRVIIRDSYARQRHYDRRGHNHRRNGAVIRAPGVSIGIGSGRY